MVRVRWGRAGLAGMNLSGRGSPPTALPSCLPSHWQQHPRWRRTAVGLRAPGRTAGRHDSLAISRESAGAGPSLPRRHRRPGRHARDAAGPETGPDPARLGPSAASLTDPKRQRPRPTRERPRNVRKPGPGRGRGSPEAHRPCGAGAPHGPAPHAAHPCSALAIPSPTSWAISAFPRSSTTHRHNREKTQPVCRKQVPALEPRSRPRSLHSFHGLR